MGRRDTSKLKDSGEPESDLLDYLDTAARTESLDLDNIDFDDLIDIEIDPK